MREIKRENRLVRCLRQLLSALLLMQLFVMPLQATTDKRQTMDVLIVGAGIAGLATAIALENHGIHYDIIEKRAYWDEQDGTGIALPANAVWALDKLGLGQELLQYSHPIPAMTFTTDLNEHLITEDITNIHCDGLEFRSIHRGVLHSILLKKIDTACLRMGTQISSLQQLDKGVEVTFSDNSEKHYDLVVGADGIHSQVRKLVFVESDLLFQGLSTWRTIIKTPQGLQHPVYMLGEQSVLLFYPLKDDLTYLYAHVAGTEKFLTFL